MVRPQAGPHQVSLARVSPQGGEVISRIICDYESEKVREDGESGQVQIALWDNLSL